MKHMTRKKNIVDFFIPWYIHALDRERDKHTEKLRQCIALTDENEKLFDTVCKQRLAIRAIKEEHEKEMAKLAESLEKANEKIAKVTAERDRYRAALARAFPSAGGKADG